MTSAVNLNEDAGAEGAGPAYCMLQWIHLYLGNLEEGLDWQEPALDRLRERFDLRWYAWSFAAASATCAYLGRFDEAIEQAHNGLIVAEEYRDSSLVTFAQFITSIVYTFRGDMTRAIEHGQIAVDTAPTLADKVWAQTFLAWAWCRADRAREGADLLASILPLYEATRFVPGQVFAGTFLAEAYWRVGQFDDAERTLEAGLELATRAGDQKFFVGWMHRLLAEIAMDKNPEQATEPLAAPQFEKCITIFRKIKAENELACAYAGYGRLHKRQGHVAEARDYFTRALTIFDRLGTLIEPGRMRAELAE
jgi:tetratricopeptide (TPR) repeat protein